LILIRRVPAIAEHAKLSNRQPTSSHGVRKTSQQVSLNPIAAVRRFNRFYTRHIGLLDEGLARPCLFSSNTLSPV